MRSYRINPSYSSLFNKSIEYRDGERERERRRSIERASWNELFWDRRRNNGDLFDEVDAPQEYTCVPCFAFVQSSRRRWVILQARVYTVYTLNLFNLRYHRSSTRNNGWIVAGEKRMRCEYYRALSLSRSRSRSLSLSLALGLGLALSLSLSLARRNFYYSIRDRLSRSFTRKGKFCSTTREYLDFVGLDLDLDSRSSSSFFSSTN